MITPLGVRYKYCNNVCELLAIRRRASSVDSRMKQRSGKEPDQPAEDAQAADAWPRWVRSACQSLHPLRGMIIESGQELQRASNLRSRVRLSGRTLNFTEPTSGPTGPHRDSRKCRFSAALGWRPLLFPW